MVNHPLQKTKRIIFLFFRFLDTWITCRTDVSKLCEFRADLNAVPKQLFERHTNSKGISYYKIRYDLVIIPTSGYMYYQQELNGVSYGRVRAEY